VAPPIWSADLDCASRPRMLELTARYADALDRTLRVFRADHIKAEYPRLLEACQKVGRDPPRLN